MSGIIIYARSMTETIVIDLASDARIWDLKKAIPGEYKIISYQGFKLVDNAATLADLGICPESTIDVNYERIPYDTFNEKYSHIVLNINLNDEWIDVIEDTVEIYSPSPHSNGTDIVEKYDKHIPNTYEYEIVAIYSHVFAPDGEEARKDPGVNGVIIRNRNPDCLMTYVEHHTVVEILESVLEIEIISPRFEGHVFGDGRGLSIFSADIYD
jgi:hypothetical protein